MPRVMNRTVRISSGLTIMATLFGAALGDFLEPSLQSLLRQVSASCWKRLSFLPLIACEPEQHPLTHTFWPVHRRYLRV